MPRSHLIAIVILSVAAGALAQEKITIQPKYQPGTYVVTTKMDANDDWSGGMAFEEKTRQLIAMEMIVDKPQGESQKIVVTCKRIKEDATRKERAYSFDSDKDEPSATRMNMLYALIDAPITVTLDAKGEVAKIDVGDKIWDKMAKDGGVVDHEMVKACGENMVRPTFGNIRRMFPTGPVAVGDTWKTKTTEEMPTFCEFQRIQTNKLGRIESAGGAQIAVVEFKGECTMVKPIQKTLRKMTQTCTGSGKINVRTGMIEELVSDGEMAMERTVAGPEGDLAITDRVKGKVVTTFKEGKYVPTKKVAETKAAEATAE